MYLQCCDVQQLLTQYVTNWKSSAFLLEQDVRGDVGLRVAVTPETGLKNCLPSFVTVQTRAGDLFYYCRLQNENCLLHEPCPD
jgi:hypothetical protein